MRIATPNYTGHSPSGFGFLFSICFSSAVLLAGMNASAQQPATPQRDGAVHPAHQQNQKQIQTLAVVNQQEISRQQLTNECLRRFGKDVLQEIINKFLITKELERNNIAITEKHVNDEIISEAGKLGMSGERWLEVISANRNLTVDQIKNDYVWNKLALQTLVASKIEVTREELNEQLEFEFGPRVQVRQIVVDTESQAQQVMQDLRNNPEEFERIAKRVSVDPNSASMGGLLPPVRRHSGFPEFEQVAFSLQTGQISNPLAIAEKFIILRCERIFPAEEISQDQLPMIQERLITELSQQKLGDAALNLFEQLQRNAQITNIMNDPKLREQHPGVAAVVDGMEIPIRHVAEVCLMRFGDEMLKTEINRTLLRAELQKAGLQVAKQDIDDEIARAAESMGYVTPSGSPDVETWLTVITENDRSKVEFYIEDEVWPTVALKKLVEKNVSVTQEDMQKGFESNFGPRVDVLAIMTDNHQQATRVWSMAASNPTSEFFGKLAHQYSIEPASRNNFGQVEPIQQHGGRPELEKEAFSLKPGEISKVVQVGKYWVIMFCQGYTEPVVTEFAAVKDEIYKSIREKKMRIAMYDKFQQLIDDAQIDNFLTGTSQTGKAQVRDARANTGSPQP